MFETAWDCSWLGTIDLLINIKTTRIAKLRKNDKEKRGVVPITKSIIKNCMNYVQALYCHKYMRLQVNSR